MSWKLIGQSDGTRTYVVVAQPDEDALGAIGELAAAEQLTAAQLTAVGAFSRASIKKGRPK
jgi:predicted DNA-binding protein with PD1-like motif